MIFVEAELYIYIGFVFFLFFRLNNTIIILNNNEVRELRYPNLFRI